MAEASYDTAVSGRRAEGHIESGRLAACGLAYSGRSITGMSSRPTTDPWYDGTKFESAEPEPLSCNLARYVGVPLTGFRMESSYMTQSLEDKDRCQYRMHHKPQRIEPTACLPAMEAPA